MDSTEIIRAKIPELDSLRGMAILVVVFYHGFFWSNGLTGLSGFSKLFVKLTRVSWLGVNLFFVLSGFLITGSWLIQRLRNITTVDSICGAHCGLPAFYVLLLVLCFIPSQSKTYLLLIFFYLSNLASPLGIPMAYTMLWSLAVEEHFYFVWPASVRHLSGRALMNVAMTIVCAEPFLRAWYFFRHWPEDSGYLTWLIADGLAMGSILAVAVRLPQFTRRRIGSSLLDTMPSCTSIGQARIRLGEEWRPCCCDLFALPD